ncbi:hydrogenase maturation protease [Arcicella aquatica]|uniref:Hydrogenase maturation protease n=1 Tax=Arcicella aquatica TaxID=217141 RepID=A0ABU5QLM5_9BACT|nr:hydrogenase maturation protease [Arcicella aquatica]MEA5257970.1 hydrogenase maturation protease [Arcicella aquatica]
MIKTAILGFGNPVRSDDAVGCYVIEQLQKKGIESNSISLFDMGTGAFEVLFKLLGHNKIIIVDAVINTGEPVGTLYKVPAEEIEAVIVDDPMVFLHSIKWDQALNYAKKIMREDYPKDITVYLIAVDNTRIEIELSEVVRKAGDKVVQYILEEIN